MTRQLSMTAFVFALCFVARAHAQPAVAPCALAMATKGLDGIYRGAQFQELRVHYEGLCSDYPIAKQVPVTFQSEPDLTFSATIQNIGDAEMVLRAFSIPAQLPLKELTWKVRIGEKEGLALKLPVYEGITVRLGDDKHPKLRASYRDGKLDALHSGAAVGGVAVVTPGNPLDPSRSRDIHSVENSAALALDDTSSRGLRAVAEEIRRLQSSAPPGCAKHPGDESCKKAQLACHDTKFDVCQPGPGANAKACKHSKDQCVDDEVLAERAPWRVRPLTWNTDVMFAEYGDDSDEYWSDTGARLNDISSVTFSVKARYSEPLRARIELVDHDGENGAEHAIYSTEVMVAESSRRESLPLPLAKLVYVTCGDSAAAEMIDPALVASGERTSDVDTAANGATRAVETADIEGGACELRYDPELYTLYGRSSRGARNPLRDFGPQDVLITVSRDGATDGTKRWVILNPGTSDHISLPVVPNGARGTGPYRVHAQLNGAQRADVTYRPAATSALPTVSTAGLAPGSLEFSTVLRPRGASGWRHVPIRTFITIPVQVFGFRMPARPRELHASSESTTIQAMSAKAGVLLAVEPWNYDSGSNPLPVPVRFLTGLHIFDLSHGSVSPALVTGVSFTFPIIDLPSGTAGNQLGTDIAIGLFWEVDLHEPRPFSNGNALLLTLGANVLSLFGSK